LVIVKDEHDRTRAIVPLDRRGNGVVDFRETGRIDLAGNAGENTATVGKRILGDS